MNELLSPPVNSQAPDTDQEDEIRPKEHYPISVKDWGLEITACAFSAVAMIALFSLLYHYDQQDLPIDVLYDLTLSTVVSAITTAVTAALTLPLTAGISQLMWQALHEKESSLNMMKLYDEASRSMTIGGATLLWKRYGGFLTTYAFVISILSYGISPFTQNALKQKSLTSNTTLPICLDLRVNPYAVDISGDLYSQFYASLYMNVNNPTPSLDEPLQSLNKNCPTGNCTWPVYSSIALCTNSTDITNRVQSEKSEGPSGPVYSYRLPNGLTLLGSEDFVINASTTLPTMNYESWGNYPITKYSIINYRETGNMSAYEGVFYWCVQGYQSAVKENLLQQNITASWYNLSAQSPRRNETIALTPPLELWPQLGLKQSTTFYVGNTAGYQNDEIQTVPWLSIAINGTANTNSLSQISWNDDWNLAQFFEQMASDMSNRLRFVACSTNVTGTINNFRTVLNVQYRWLILPYITVAATPIFLALLIVGNKGKTPVWKGSILAVLFHGLEPDLLKGQKMASSIKIDDMENLASSIRVHLVSSGEEDGGGATELALRETQLI